MGNHSNFLNTGLGLFFSVVQCGLPLSFFYPFFRIFRGGASRRILIIYGSRRFFGAVVSLLIWCRATDWLYTSLMANEGTAMYLKNIPYIHYAVPLMAKLYLPVWDFLATIVQRLFSILMGG